MPNKYTNISAKLRATRARFDAQIEDLDKEIDAAGSESDEAVRDHRMEVSKILEGVADLRTGIKEMRGNGEEADTQDDKVTSFPGGAKTSGVG